MSFHKEIYGGHFILQGVITDTSLSQPIIIPIKVRKDQVYHENDLEIPLTQPSRDKEMSETS